MTHHAMKGSYHSSTLGRWHSNVIKQQQWNGKFLLCVFGQKAPGPLANGVHGAEVVQPVGDLRKGHGGTEMQSWVERDGAGEEKMLDTLDNFSNLLALVDFPADLGDQISQAPGG